MKSAIALIVILPNCVFSASRKVLWFSLYFHDSSLNVIFLAAVFFALFFVGSQQDLYVAGFFGFFFLKFRILDIISLAIHSALFCFFLCIWNTNYEYARQFDSVPHISKALSEFCSLCVSHRVISSSLSVSSAVSIDFSCLSSPLVSPSVSPLKRPFSSGLLFASSLGSLMYVPWMS